MAAGRGLGVAGAVALVAMGFVFALGGGESGGVPANESPPAPKTPTLVATGTSVPGAIVAEVPTAAPSPVPEAPAATPAAPPPAPPTVPVRNNPPTVAPQLPVPVPTAELPKYRDIQVLALAADAVLPSGYTFRECMNLPPAGEGWPASVHLYWEGNGRWLVETHVSEVQVVFDEATATFSVRNFAPVNAACLVRR